MRTRLAGGVALAAAIGVAGGYAARAAVVLRPVPATPPSPSTTTGKDWNPPRSERR